MLDLEKLKKLAEAATPGPWEAMFVFGSKDLPCEVVKETNKTQMVAGIECPIHLNICDVSETSENPTPNFRFIAAANPETILAMIEMCEDYREALNRIESYNSIKEDWEMFARSMHQIAKDVLAKHTPAPGGERDAVKE